MSIDLSKAFVTLQHELILPKLMSYGTDDKTIDQVYDYLSNHHPQRVRLGDQFSNWNEISAGVPQGSVLGPLIFNISLKDLVYAVKQGTLSAYAYDTQIFVSHSTLKKEGRGSSSMQPDLAKVDK